jgi:hypothetical protein
MLSTTENRLKFENTAMPTLTLIPTHAAALAGSSQRASPQADSSTITTRLATECAARAVEGVDEVRCEFLAAVST